MNENELLVSADIAAEIINQSSLKMLFSKQINEKIIRLEAYKIKRKLDVFTLSIIISLIAFTSIILILEITKEIFNNEIIIPVLMIILLVIISGIFILEYFIVKKTGIINLNKKLEPINKVNRKLVDFQLTHALIYTFSRNAFESIKKVASKFLLNAYLLKFIMNYIKAEKIIVKEEVFKYLFLISTRKNFDLEKIIKPEEKKDFPMEDFKKQLFNFEFILMKFIKMEKIPLFFKDSAQKTIDFIKGFKGSKFYHSD